MTYFILKDAVFLFESFLLCLSQPRDDPSWLVPQNFVQSVSLCLFSGKESSKSVSVCRVSLIAEENNSRKVVESVETDSSR